MLSLSGSEQPNLMRRYRLETTLDFQGVLVLAARCDVSRENTWCYVYGAKGKVDLG